MSIHGCCWSIPALPRSWCLSHFCLERQWLWPKVQPWNNLFCIITDESPLWYSLWSWQCSCCSKEIPPPDLSDAYSKTWHKVLTFKEMFLCLVLSHTEVWPALPTQFSSVCRILDCHVCQIPHHWLHCTSLEWLLSLPLSFGKRQSRGLMLLQGKWFAFLCGDEIQSVFRYN